MATVENAACVTVVGETVMVNALCVEGDTYLLTLLDSIPEASHSDMVRRSLGIGARVLVDEVNAQTLERIRHERHLLAQQSEAFAQTVATLSHTIQAAVESLFRTYFEGEGGKVPAALERKTESLMRAIDQRVRDMSAKFDPNDPASWTASMRDIAAAAVGQTLAVFAQSLSEDERQGPLAGLFANDTQIRNLLENLGQKLDGVTERLAARQARAATTQRGSDYESLAFSALSLEAERYADTAIRVGKRAGHAGTQDGDLVLQLNPDDSGARVLSIVFEVRNRDMSKRDPRKVLDELDRAMANHGAQAAVLVVASSEYMPADATDRPFKAYGGNRFATVLAPEGPDPGFFAVACQIARVLVRTQARVDVTGEPSIDMVRALDLLTAIEAKAQIIHQARTSLRSIRSTAKTAYDTLGTFTDDIAAAVAELRTVLDAPTAKRT